MAIAELAGGAARGLRWWTGSLRELVPESLKRRFARVRRRLAVRIGADRSLTLAVETLGRRRILATLAVGVSDGARGEQAVADALRGWRLRVDEVRLELPAAAALRARMSLPRAAVGNLAQVIAFELDRQTPFRRDDVYFGYRVIAGASRAALALELTVVPRAQLDPALAFARRAGVPPDAVAVAGEAAGEPATEILMGGLAAVPRPRFAERAFATAAALGLALGLAALLIPYYQAHATADALAQELATAQKQAAASRKLEGAVETARQNRRLLVTRKNETAPVSEVLLALTRALPDDTWLSELQLTGNEVQIVGTSAAAASVIGLLDQSPLFANAAFRAPVTQDAKSGREQFSVAVQVRPRKAP